MKNYDFVNTIIILRHSPTCANEVKISKMEVEHGKRFLDFPNKKEYCSILGDAIKESLLCTESHTN